MTAHEERLADMRLIKRGMTPRQFSIVILLVQRHTNKQIAARLRITEGTAKQQVRNVLRVLGFNRRRQVEAWISRKAAA